jgi:hypothetical protein
MKKQFTKLSKAEQEKAEQEYHRMKPAEFEHVLRRAKKHMPAGSTAKRKTKSAEKKRAA